MSAEAFGKLSGYSVARLVHYRGAKWSTVVGRPRVPAKPVRNYARTLESCKQEIRKFQRVKGRRPQREDLRAVGSWLYRNTEHTLASLCDEMGIGRGPVTNRTVETCRREVQQFYENVGRRPTKDDLPAVNHWLRRHARHTVRTLCDEMAIGRGPRLDRDKKSCIREIQEFLGNTGRRPTKDDLPSINSWLRRNGQSSLSAVCDELGLPTLRRCKSA